MMMKLKRKMSIDELYNKIVIGGETSHFLYDCLYEYKYDEYVLFLVLKSFGFEDISEYEKSEKVIDEVETAIDNFQKSSVNTELMIQSQDREKTSFVDKR